MSTPVQLQQSIDPTGILSQLDLSQQDISNIIDQFNALQDQLNGGNITQNSQQQIVFDGTTNRVLVGYQQVLQAWGLFVSQIGIDVTQATADQLIFNSNQDVFKIIKSGIITLPQMASVVFPDEFTTSSASLDTGIIINDPLIVMGFISNGGYQTLPYMQTVGTGGNGGGISYIVQLFSGLVGGSLQLTLQGINYSFGTARGPFDVKYYVLQETAN